MADPTPIDRLEAATEPSRELDAEIAPLVGWEESYIPGAGWVWRGPGDRNIPGPFPRFTSSIDAALTLVPEGFSVELGIYTESQDTPRSGSFARVNKYCMGDGPAWEIDAEQAATPALAICIAALKASGGGE